MRFLLLFLAALLFPGCASEPTPAKFDPFATGQAVKTPLNAAGFTAEETRIGSLDLRQHLSTNEVIALLGRPDETALKNYGGATGAAWHGTEWIYRWPGRRLSVVFQVDNSARERRLDKLEDFMVWAEANKEGAPANPTAPAFSAEQIGARRMQVQPELDQLRSAALKGEDYLVVNSWSWSDY